MHLGRGRWLEYFLWRRIVLLWRGRGVGCLAAPLFGAYVLVIEFDQVRKHADDRLSVIGLHCYRIFFEPECIQHRKVLKELYLRQVSNLVLPQVKLFQARTEGKVF